MASKGKGIADYDSPGKRKRKDNDNGGSNKRKNRAILQFFEDSAAEFDGDYSDDIDSDDDFFDLDDFFNDLPKVKSEPDGFEQFPSFPKEEELSGDELEKMLAERYRTRSGHVRYAEDDYDTKRSVDKNFLVPSVVEPTIWKVKCKVGREKNTVFCLIQKFVDLKDLGTKLQIISAFAVEHIKGFVFIEAEKQSDVAAACNQLADVYFSLVTKVPSNEVGQLLVVRKRYNEVKEGTWARVKNGIYRGDLAQVVAVNNVRKRATVKLIPRIDLQALTEKYGGGAISKRTKGSIPAARLINSRDLEEFRPLIQYRRDRDTGKMFEFLDSLMLKDGFLYKKVSIDSLSFWGVNPTEDELQKFTVPSNDESDNAEWLSQLYGEPKKCTIQIDKGGGKGGGKGEGSSGSHEQSSFDVHDLVLFGKREFGMVIGMEKDDNYKILKDGSEGPVILTQGQKDLKHVPQDKKFTALDHRMKTISINDTVKILDGPSKERQGIVKQIYRGIIFLYDENDLDNAYCCTKSQMSEKVKNAGIVCHGKDEGGPSSFEDIPSSPKSPLSPKKVWEMRGNNNEGKDEQFSVGQSLRIRIGPLKGYLCRVVAIRYSDVTVKLDSKQKVLTVKREHLVEVREKSAASLIGDPESSSPFKPFDLLGTDGTTNDWLQQASGSADGDGWNVGGLSSQRSAWPSFPSSSSSLQVGTSSADLHSSVNDDWGSKVAVTNGKAVDDTGGAWGTSAGGWGKEKAPGGDHGGSWNTGGSSFGQGKSDNAVKNWGNQSAEKAQSDSWDKGKSTEEQGGWNGVGSSGASGSFGWGNQKTCGNIGNAGGDSWAEPKISSGPVENSWGKAADGWGKKNSASENSGWGSLAATSSQLQAKDSENKGSEDPWGKVADKWGNKDSSNRGNDWGTTTNKSSVDGSKGWGASSGGWTNSLKENPEVGGSASGGWKSGGDSAVGGSWGKSGGFGADRISSFDKTGGNDSWGQSNNFENDGGFSRGRGPGVRGRGRDQFGRGRGRGRSFDRGQSSSFNKDSQDNYSSGSKGWGDQHGSSWGNSSVENVVLTSSWGKEKGWNDSGADNKGWNKSNEPDKDVGGWSMQKSSQQAGWNGASSGISSWGQKSYESGGNEAQDKDTNGPDDPWGILSSKTSNNKSGASQGSWGGGQGNTGGWKKDDTSSGWTKSGDVSSGGRDSWSKPEGNNSFEGARNSDNDQGHSWGGGSGGRRGGRGGFRGGRDQSGRGGFRGRGGEFGRGGGGRSGGRGQFSNWKNEGQNGGGSSWGNSNNEGNSWGKGGWSTDRGGQDSGWKKPNEGSSSWGAGSSGGGGQDSSWKKPNEGSFSWGAGSSGGGGQDSSWKKPNEGSSSWGAGSSDGGAKDPSWKKPITDNKASGGYSNSSKGGWGTGGAGGEDIGGWKKPSEGGSSWGGESNKQNTGWGNDSSSKGQDNAATNETSKSGGNWAAGSSWGNSQSGPSSDAGGGWGSK